MSEILLLLTMLKKTQKCGFIFTEVHADNAYSRKFNESSAY